MAAWTTRSWWSWASSRTWVPACVRPTPMWQVAPTVRGMPPRKRRQRGHIGQLPRGAYHVRVYAGTDALTGRPRGYAALEIDEEFERQWRGL